MNYRILKWMGLVLIVEAGFLHYAASQAAYLRAPYLGFLLIAEFIGALIAAVGVHRKSAWGWLLGAVLGIGSLIGYVWNSTIGLPKLSPMPWLYPYAVVAGVAEALFILLTALRPWRLVDRPLAASFRYEIFLPSVLIFVGLIAMPTYRWDLYASEVGYHRHVASVPVICSTPVTSLAELEQRYGIQLSLAAMSMLDGVVDVRMKILDPEKASKLLKDQVALLVDQQFLVLAPHLHHHVSLKRNKVHSMFFPTLSQRIHAGSEVSLVFGPIRVEAITVR